MAQDHHNQFILSPTKTCDYLNELQVSLDERSVVVTGVDVEQDPLPRRRHVVGDCRPHVQAIDLTETGRVASCEGQRFCFLMSGIKRVGPRTN